MKHQHDAAGVGFLKIPENVLRIYKHPNYVRKQILIGYKCCITLLSSLTLDFLLELAWNYILKRFVNFSLKTLSIDTHLFESFFRTYF